VGVEALATARKTHRPDIPSGLEGKEIENVLSMVYILTLKNWQKYVKHSNFQTRRLQINN